MELEELKTKKWQNEVSYSLDELESIFEIRTKSTIKNVNRKMFIDAMLMLLTTTVLISTTFWLGLRSKYIVSGQIIGFACFLLMHYRIKYLILNNVNLLSNTIRDGIASVYKRLYNYIIAYYIFIPIFAISLMFKIRSDLGYQIELSTENALIYSVTLMGSILVVYLLSTVLYKKDLARLKSLLSTLMDY